MSRRDAADAVVEPLRPWQRRLYAALALAGGGGMIVAGVVQGAALVQALGALPPVITVNTGLAGLLPMGVAIVGFGTLALGSPAPAEPPLRRPAPTRRRLDRAQRVTALGLGCLLLFPLLTIVLRVGTADYLEARGYHREIADPGFHSRFPSIRWSRVAPSD